MIQQVVELLKTYPKIEFDERNFPINWSYKLRKQINNDIYSIVKGNKFEYLEDKDLTNTINEYKIKLGFNEGRTQIYAYVELNDNYKEIVCHDVNNLQFNTFYPNSMLFLQKRKLIKLDDEHLLPLEFIVNNKKEILINYDPEEMQDINMIMRLFVNYFYGYVMTDKELIRINCENRENFGFFNHYVLDSIYTKLGQNSIYSDTDCIYYGGDKDIPTYIIKNIYKEYDIPFEIDIIDNIIFFARKKYIEANRGEVKIKGFKSIKV
jgi:hypothetical protein